MLQLCFHSFTKKSSWTMTPSWRVNSRQITVWSRWWFKKTNQKHPHWTDLKKNPVQHNKAWKTFVASVFILLLNDGDIVYMQWRLITTLKTNARHCMFEWSAVSFPGLFKAVLVFHWNDWFAFICHVWEVTVVSTEALSVLKLVLSQVVFVLFLSPVHQVCWLNKCMYCV